MPTIFTKIIQGEIPCYKIFEDEHTFAFLDIKPHQLGHTLIVPKIETDFFADVAEPYYSAVFKNAQMIAKAIQKATGCPRVGMSVLGFEVPHFHLHLIPLIEMYDIDPRKARERTPEEMKNVHEKILQALEEAKTL